MINLITAVNNGKLMKTKTVYITADLFLKRLFHKLRFHCRPHIETLSELTVNLVTSWNTRCGIAAYSSMLANELKNDVKLKIVDVPKNRTFSPYFFVLGHQNGRKNEVTQVQFAYGMFPGFLQSRRYGFSDFGALLYYLGLAFSKSLIVTTFHEVKIKKNTSGKIKVIYEKLLDKVICNVSDLIIVHTNESKKYLIKDYGMNEKRIKVIPMGCFEYPKINNKDKAKEMLNLTGKKVITIPGFISKNHGIDLMVSILPYLEKETVLLISGGTRTKENEQYREKLKEIAKQNHTEKRLFFIDEYPIPVTVFNATDIAVLPYRYATESLSLRMLVAYDIPTITSNLKFFREIKKQYSCLETFETNNTESLLAETIELLNNHEKQNNLREKCTEMWRQNRWSEIAKQYVATYFEAMSSHPDKIYDKIQ